MVSKRCKIAILLATRIRNLPKNLPKKSPTKICFIDISCMVKKRGSMGSKGRKIAILLATRGPSDDGLIFKVAIIEIGIIRWVLGVGPLAGCTKSRQRMRL